ncbi:MAG: hypothetical protein ACI32B_04890, partial [Erysipelotrichaceae bacterium]
AVKKYKDKENSIQQYLSTLKAETPLFMGGFGLFLYHQLSKMGLYNKILLLESVYKTIFLSFLIKMRNHQIKTVKRISQIRNNPKPLKPVIMPIHI